jgi:methyl-accepting chemotaxis protein
MKALSNLKILNKMLAAFGVIILVSIVANAVIWYQNAILEDAKKWTNHTYVVLDQASSILESMINRETGLRGFIITGDPASLKPYEDGGKKYETSFKEIKRLTSDNATQQKRLDEMNDAVQQWDKGVAQAAIGFMKDPATRDQAAKLERDGAGRQFFGVIRGKLAEIDADERKLLVVRAQAQDHALSTSSTAILSAATLMLLFAGLSVYGLNLGIVKPVVAMTGAMGRLADKDWSTEVPAQDRGDEIGQMAKAVQVFKESGMENERLQKETEEARIRQAASDEEQRRLKEEAAKADERREREAEEAKRQAEEQRRQDQERQKIEAEKQRKAR